MVLTCVQGFLVHSTTPALSASPLTLCARLQCRGPYSAHFAEGAHVCPGTNASSAQLRRELASCPFGSAVRAQVIRPGGSSCLCHSPGGASVCSESLQQLLTCPEPGDAAALHTGCLPVPPWTGKQEAGALVLARCPGKSGKAPPLPAPSPGASALPACAKSEGKHWGWELGDAHLVTQGPCSRAAAPPPVSSPPLSLGCCILAKDGREDGAYLWTQLLPVPGWPCCPPWTGVGVGFSWP